MPRDRRMRDMRNPYGSRGGYVSSDRARDRARERDRERRDRARRDRSRGRRDYAEMDEEIYREPCVRYSNSVYGVPASREEMEDQARRDYARRDRARRERQDYDGHYGSFGGYYSLEDEDYARDRGDYRGRDYGDYNRGYGRDRDYGGYGMDYADEDELKYYEKKLSSQLDEKAKSMFKKDDVLEKAEKLGIKFEDYDEEEFYIVVLMMFTDFGKTIGTTNPDIYIRMAKNWLEDDDSNLQYSEKLYEYLEKIVDAE